MSDEIKKEEKENLEIYVITPTEMEENFTEDKKEITEAKIVKLNNIETLDEMLLYTQKLVDSKILPFNSPEKALVAYQFGKELGLGIVTAMNNIHVISGRTTLSVHAISALLKKSGIQKQTIEDFEDYSKEYTDEEGNVKVATTKRTTIKFFYKWEGRVLEEVVSLTWADAIKAGWADKDNWKKMPIAI